MDVHDLLGNTSAVVSPQASSADQGSHSDKGAPTTEKDRVGRRTNRLRLFRPSSPGGIYAGLVLVAMGFGLIGITWGKVAGLVEVPLQLPFFVSGGLTALGLIILGATTINIAVRRRDSAERIRQLQQLIALLREMRDDANNLDRK